MGNAWAGMECLHSGALPVAILLGVIRAAGDYF